MTRSKHSPRRLKSSTPPKCLPTAGTTADGNPPKQQKHPALPVRFRQRGVFLSKVCKFTAKETGCRNREIT